jgi:Flp pilus assembly protein TadG
MLRFDRRRHQQVRRGAIVPLTAVLMLPLVGMLAFALDVGLLALARSQTQSAADAAALAGARKLNGDYTGSTNGNFGLVQGASEASIANNRIASKLVSDTNPQTGDPFGSLTTKIGSYRYDTSANKFYQDYSATGPTPPTEASGAVIPWSLVKATVTYRYNGNFSKLWGAQGFDVTATATAAHRPRDIAVVVDFSGSMGFDSNLGVPWSGDRDRTNNPDKAYPRFGHYSYAAGLQNGTNQHAYDLYQGASPNPSDRDYNLGNITVNPKNVNASFLDAEPIVHDFVTRSGSSLVQAWQPSNFPSVSSDSYTPPSVNNGVNASSNTFQDVPGGDNFKLINMNASTGTAYARNVTELTGATSNTTRRSVATSTSDADFEVFGYSFFGDPASGFPTSGYKEISEEAFPATDNLGRTPQRFAGYTQGPRYWGKTFFLWPSDPRRPVTASDRLVWNGTAWVTNAEPGMLNKWLADLDRNWILLPNGRRTTSSSASVVGMTRYAAGAYDALLANWPLDSTGALRSSYWTRAQVERFLRGEDPTTGADIRPASNYTSSYNSTPTSSTPVAESWGSSTYVARPTVDGGGAYVTGSTTAFWTGPVIDRTSGSGLPANAANYPKVNFAQLGSNTANNLLVEGLTTNSTATFNVAPSPALLGPSDAIPSAQPSWSSAPTQAQIDAQIARLILGLYDNIQANFDWRARYFTAPSTSSAWPSNASLYASKSVQSSTGFYLRTPAPEGNSTSYHINYPAVLKWLKESGPNPFPANLRCGRIVYYNAIPDTITLPNPSDPDERFWKEYIDFVLGFRPVTPNPGTYGDSHHYTGYGRDFPFNGSSISSNPSDTTVVAIRSRTSGGSSDRASHKRLAPYMNYGDNPMRPKTRLWFGPMTMVDFLTQQNLGNPFGGTRQYLSLCPGACNQSQSISCKLGVRGALLDSKQNHPNDRASLIFFSGAEMNSLSPKRFRTVRSPMSQDFDKMTEYLFFPPATVGTGTSEINWTDGEMNEVPSSNGGTCYDLALMLAYNQFSSESTLLNADSGGVNGQAGGLGRHGAQKIVIFESDGMANTKCNIPTFIDNGQYKRYYRVRAADSITLSSVSSWTSTSLLSVSQKIGASLASGGYTATNRPAMIHTIGFGFLFESSYTGTDKDAALATFKAMQNAANVDDTTDGSTLYTGSEIADYKIVTGTSTQRIEKMKAAFAKILQEKSIALALIE